MKRNVFTTVTQENFHCKVQTTYILLFLFTKEIRGMQEFSRYLLYTLIHRILSGQSYSIPFSFMSNHLIAHLFQVVASAEL